MVSQVRKCKYCCSKIELVNNLWGIAQNPSANSGDTYCAAAHLTVKGDKQYQHSPLDVGDAPGHYRAAVTCANCETPNTLVIPKQMKVQTYLVIEQRYCSYCGCGIEELDELDHAN